MTYQEKIDMLHELSALLEKPNLSKETRESIDRAILLIVKSLV